MTAHATTLPGMPLVGRDVLCRGEHCSVPIPKPGRGDKVETWHAVLKHGESAIIRYLHEHNSGVTHNESCEFRDLPPSVHHLCYKVDEQYDALAEHLEMLKASLYQAP
ncbi:hypothetical protein [Actinomadura sp. B10D3]|uniref:hypothetical protein n=1 Tax=Actinomadura sp. B10D3 TaxID=3153557 RepID=UPI00325C72E5